MKTLYIKRTDSRIERDNGEFSDIENVVEIIYNAIKYGEGV